MKKARTYLCGIVVMMAVSQGFASEKVIWQIGTKDGKGAELALAPSDYQKFLEKDFGWEDRFYLVGWSSPASDFPYVLPGPADRWGGTSGTAGLRTHMLNILYNVGKTGNGEWKLVIDLADINNESVPLLKVDVNGQSRKFVLPAGGGNASLDGNYSAARSHTIEIPLSGIVKEGNNQVIITILEGSWIVFDDIRLYAPDGAELVKPNGKAYVRSVKAAGYQTRDPQAQPLLVQAEYLSGTPVLTVELDGKAILSERLEEGAYLLEAPMPAVNKPRKSKYAILADGERIASGEVNRFPAPIVTPADYVDTHMGSAHSRWMLAPGPWMPFSMVKLSPDNQNRGWQSGYDPSFESVGTFSHIHEWTMGGLGIMPVNGPLKIKIGNQSEMADRSESYRSLIDKNSEQAGLGYYSVHLTDYDIVAELTATTRCGFQRYTYPAGKPGRVMVDLKIPAEYNYEILECRVEQTGPSRIEGYSKQESKNVWSRDADQYYTLHFVIEFDKEIRSFGGWENGRVWDGKNRSATAPTDFGCYVEFDTARGNVVQVRSAISYVDIEGAANNLRAEVERPFGWDFDKVRQAQKDAWNDILGRLEVKGNDSKEKTRFYTNFYRSFCRNTFSDIDGRWRDAADITQKFDNPDNVALGCDAFWNTFWNLNQVWNLITPEWSSRWVRSQLAMYDAGGWLAKGPAGMKYVPVMVAEHEIPLIIGAYQMGIRDYDTNKLFEAVKKMQTTPGQKVGRGFAGNRDLEHYLAYKYVPADLGRYSNTLEYSFDDWCVGQLAKAMGKDEDYRIFSDRGTWWRNAIDPETGYARLRNSDGEWEPDFDPFKSGANRQYVEGNAWQLTYFVPQDVPALAEAIGKDRFTDRLTWGFESSEGWRYNAPGDQYWDFPVVQGNQQSMHFAFLFNWVGQPWQTQRWSRSVMDRYYGHGFDNAWLGDEDQGQMSAWFVMAALGLFQTDGGCSAEPIYEIASPFFGETVIDLGSRYGRGGKFTIKAANASKLNKYVQSAKLNGKPLNTFKIPAKTLLSGGTLELEMGPDPNTSWGIE